MHSFSSVHSINHHIQEANMLQSELLYELDGFQISVGLFVALIGASFLGFRMGRYFARRGRAALQAQVQTIEAAMLTLLALLLAFTFSIAASRFDSRKQVCVQEANAIGTTYLRASLMPRSESVTQLRGLLRQYVDMRIDVYTHYLTPEARKLQKQRVSDLQRDMWGIVAASSRDQPMNVAVTLIVRAMNDLIDLAETQSALFENHVPENILIFLFALAIVVISVVSYMNGLSLDRQPSLMFLLAGIVAMTIFLLIDLDRPLRGLIRVAPASMQRAKAAMIVEDRL